MTDGAQCYVWDITISAREYDGRRTINDIHLLLRPVCKKYVLQLERGEEKTTKNPDGYLHYQGRVSVYKKSTQSGVAAQLKESGLTHFHISPTTNTGLKGEAFYCMKSQTKIDGPWTDKDYKAPKPDLWTVEMVKNEGLYPWQEAMRDNLIPYDRRTIHVIVDTGGNVGKSVFCMYMWHNDYAAVLPGTMNSAEDLCQFSMNHPHRAYLIDMPRAMKKNKLFGLYSGIETLKNGYLYDKRYSGKYMYINEPNICVFTNTPPKLRYLSADRWKIWTVKDKNLVPYEYKRKDPKTKKRKRDSDGGEEEV